MRHDSHFARGGSPPFGIEASGAVESYKLLLSQLSPELAKQPKALNEMGRHVATLSKLMGGDAKSATEVLTTAMNQYGVDLSNPIEARWRAATGNYKRVCDPCRSSWFIRITNHKASH